MWSWDTSSPLLNRTTKESSPSTVSVGLMISHSDSLLGWVTAWVWGQCHWHYSHTVDCQNKINLKLQQAKQDSTTLSGTVTEPRLPGHIVTKFHICLKIPNCVTLSAAPAVKLDDTEPRQVSKFASWWLQWQEIAWSAAQVPLLVTARVTDNKRQKLGL